MRKEKHTINNRYGMHGLHRDIPVYEMNTVHCSASPMEGYKGTEVTLIDDAAWNEKFSAWQVTGATVTGNNLILNNDVTAKAVYETAKNLTLQTDGHGQIASTRMSGFIGDQATLSNSNPAQYYAFSGYSITGATLTGNKFNFIGNDVTAKAWFTMTGVHVNLIYSGGNIDPTTQSPGIVSAHTYFLYEPDTQDRVNITDPYVVIQYDYASYWNNTRGSHNIFFYNYYDGGAWIPNSMSFNDAASSLTGNAHKGIIWGLHEGKCPDGCVNTAYATRLSIDGHPLVASKDNNFAYTQHHYKLIAKSDGSEISAYVDGTLYARMYDANDRHYRNQLIIEFSGNAAACYLHNISYVSTTSFADALAYNT